MVLISILAIVLAQPVSELKPEAKAADAALPGAAEPAVKRAAFRPSVHGFRFRNGFSGSPLPPVIRDMPGELGKSLREGLGEGMKLPERFGLCGGMSLAAADCYLAGTARPRQTTPPKEGTPLYEYLFKRQNDSLGSMGLMAVKFARWMNLPDTCARAGTDALGERAESAAGLTTAEVERIVSRLNEGQLVPVGLVYVRAAGNKKSDAEAGRMWENHQVLAYAVREREGAREFLVYDPNYPDDDECRIVTRAEAIGGTEVKDAPLVETRCEQVTGGGRKIRVRGVFAMPYAAVKPEIGG